MMTMPMARDGMMQMHPSAHRWMDRWMDGRVHGQCAGATIEVLMMGLLEQMKRMRSLVVTNINWTGSETLPIVCNEETRLK